MPDRIIREERKSSPRWWVPASMLLCLVVLWIVMFTGGQKAALAWYLLQVLGLVLGPLTLLVLIGYAIRKRRFSAPLQLSVVISLFATWPLLWAIGFLSIPFPRSPQDLQRHSVRVHAGDRVREGYVLAACGNSGNSNGPHIHIHHQRQDPMRSPSFLAEGLPLYFKDLDGAAMPRGGFEMRGRRSVFIGEYVRSRIPGVP